MLFFINYARGEKVTLRARSHLTTVPCQAPGAFYTGDLQYLAYCSLSAHANLTAYYKLTEMIQQTFLNQPIKFQNFQYIISFDPHINITYFYYDNI